MTRRRLAFLTAASVLAAALAFGVRSGSGAQQPPMQGPPPTYDYDPMTPGVQGPTSPALANWVARHVRTHQFTVTVLVPLAELQTALPPGYEAIASPVGSDTAAVSLLVMYQLRHACPDGRVATTSSYFAAATARNVALDRPESLNLDTVATDPGFIAAWNGDCGVGGARPGSIAIEIRETGGMLRFAWEVADRELGLRLRVAGAVPSAIPNRFLGDPLPAFFRAVTGVGQVGAAFRLAGQGDNVLAPVASADVEIAGDPGKGRYGTLPLLGARLTILGPVGSVAVARNGEFFFKPE